MHLGIEESLAITIGSIGGAIALYFILKRLWKRVQVPK
ncbi:MAG: hypothetical protein KatS3mg003_0517 [Candidatus Nitrosocaldaceae archaeon]|nr:MAG: hypothetical protein KatS3mg003_0517 [Candidatus Nitrosocaldaceae archaeon]